MTTADEERELLPCPFCGAPAELNENLQGRNYWYVTCPSCDFDLDMPTKAGAIAAWNTRAGAKP